MPLPRDEQALPDRPAMQTERIEMATSTKLAPDETWGAGAILLAPGQSGPPAAGSFDALWAPLAGMPLLARSLAVFAQAAIIRQSVLVVTPSRSDEAVALLATQGWQRVHVIADASPRLRDSLRHALNLLPPDMHWVVIHDAARPFFTWQTIATGLAAARDTGAAAASIPVHETLKRVRGDVVVETPERARLVLVQTPQVFSRPALLAACDGAPADLNAPDAATLAVAAGLRVALFPGAPENLRIVTAADIALAEAFLAGASLAQ